jgi:tetratricopeptide (TPR) repeat protein
MSVGSRVRLLDGEGLREFATLEAPDDAPTTLHFTPDGSRLILTAGRPAHVRVWDLRLLRSELAKMGLDWDAPPYPPVKAAETQPRSLNVELQLMDPLEAAARRKETQGNQHRANKEFAEAIACYREVIQSEPHNSNIMNTVAWLMAIGPPEVRDGHEALELLQRVRAWEPTNPWTVNTLGAAQYRAGQHAEGLSSLRQAEKQFQSDKNFPWPLNWLPQALCLAKLGERDAAQAMVEKSTVWLKDPGMPNAKYRNDAELLHGEAEALLQETK